MAEVASAVTTTLDLTPVKEALEKDSIWAEIYDGALFVWIENETQQKAFDAVYATQATEARMLIDIRHVRPASAPTKQEPLGKASAQVTLTAPPPPPRPHAVQLLACDKCDTWSERNPCTRCKPVASAASAVKTGPGSERNGKSEGKATATRQLTATVPTTGGRFACLDDGFTTQNRRSHNQTSKVTAEHRALRTQHLQFAVECRNVKAGRTCSFGDTCAFLHAAEERRYPAQWTRRGQARHIDE